MVGGKSADQLGLDDTVCDQGYKVQLASDYYCVLQQLVLGLSLFTIFVNELGEWDVMNLCRFAGNSRVTVMV